MGEQADRINDEGLDPMLEVSAPLIPPKLSKSPLRRIVDQESRSFSAITGKAIFKLDCGHTIYMRPQAGLMESWRRVRCKECVKTRARAQKTNPNEPFEHDFGYLTIAKFSNHDKVLIRIQDAKRLIIGEVRTDIASFAEAMSGREK